MKKITFVVSIFMIVAMLAACAPAAPAATEAPAAPAATEAPAAPAATEAPTAPAIPALVNAAIAADPGDLAPWVGMSYGRIMVLHTLYEYLFDLAKAGDPLTPYIAKGYEQTGEKTFVVTLFDNVYDSAGNHVTAADASYSYNTAMEMGNLRPLGGIESVKATGDYTVEFVLKDAPGKGDLEKILTEAPVVSQKAYESSSDKFATKPVTTSPYLLTEYVPGSSLTFEKRDDYWQQDKSQGPKYNQANVQKIVYQVITEPAQHAIALQTGSADVSGAVSSTDAAQFKDNPDFSLFTFQDNLTQLIVFNGSDGNPFTKKELRQAAAYAIDSKSMCEAVSPGACTMAHTIGNSNFGGYMTSWDTEPYYDVDLAKAKELFAAAGYKGGDLKVKLLAQNDPRSGLMAQIIQSQLKELGVDVEINQVEASVFNQLKTDPKAWDMMIDAAAGGDFIVNPWQLVYDQNRNNGTTGGFVKDDQLQALLDTAVKEFTPEALDAFQQYQKEQAYDYGLLSFHNIVVAVKGITKVVVDGRGQIFPPAFEFAADFGK